MAKMRSITTLTSNHVGLHIKIVDLDQTYKGQLTGIEAAPTHSPNEHPTVWIINIDDEPNSVSSAALWKRLPIVRPGQVAITLTEEAAWQTAVSAIPRFVIRGIGRLIDAF